MLLKLAVYQPVAQEQQEHHNDFQQQYGFEGISADHVDDDQQESHEDCCHDEAVNVDKADNCDENQVNNEVEQKLLQSAAGFLGRQMEQ